MAIYLTDEQRNKNLKSLFPTPVGLGLTPQPQMVQTGLQIRGQGYTSPITTQAQTRPFVPSTSIQTATNAPVAGPRLLTPAPKVAPSIPVKTAAITPAPTTTPALTNEQARKQLDEENRQIQTYGAVAPPTSIQTRAAAIGGDVNALEAERRRQIDAGVGQFGYQRGVMPLVGDYQNKVYTPKEVEAITGIRGDRSLSFNELSALNNRVNAGNQFPQLVYGSTGGQFVPGTAPVGSQQFKEELASGYTFGAGGPGTPESLAEATARNVPEFGTTVATGGGRFNLLAPGRSVVGAGGGTGVSGFDVQGALGSLRGGSQLTPQEEETLRNADPLNRANIVRGIINNRFDEQRRTLDAANQARLQGLGASNINLTGGANVASTSDDRINAERQAQITNVASLEKQRSDALQESDLQAVDRSADLLFKRAGLVRQREQDQLERIKSLLDIQSKTEAKSKPLEVGNNLVQFNEETKKWEVVYTGGQQQAKPIELSPGATLYDPATGKALFTAPEKANSSIIQEYNFYKNQEENAGRTPLSFDEYQTKDINRRAKSAGGGGGGGAVGLGGNYDTILKSLNATKGEDGFVNTDAYKKLRTTAKDKSTFDANFGWMLNPGDQTASDILSGRKSTGKSIATSSDITEAQALADNGVASSEILAAYPSVSLSQLKNIRSLAE